MEIDREKFANLTPKAKRRRIIVWAIEDGITLAGILGGGYLFCLAIHFLQVLCGVA